VLQAEGGLQQGILLGSGTTTPNSPPNATTTLDTTAPVITIIGNNPATIPIGASYIDPGATVTDTDALGAVNNNLGLHFSVDGVDMPAVSIDTTASTTAPQATTTHTIIYSAVDGNGNWGFATRTVDVIQQ
jgi:hypothetical protein